MQGNTYLSLICRERMLMVYGSCTTSPWSTDWKNYWGPAQTFVQEPGIFLQIHPMHLLHCGMGQEKTIRTNVYIHTIVFPPPFPSPGHVPVLFQSRGMHKTYRITHWNQEIWCMPNPSKGEAGNRSGIRPATGPWFTITMLSPSVQL